MVAKELIEAEENQLLQLNMGEGKLLGYHWGLFFFFSGGSFPLESGAYHQLPFFPFCQGILEVHACNWCVTMQHIGFAQDSSDRSDAAGSPGGWPDFASHHSAIVLVLFKCSRLADEVSW